MTTYTKREARILIDGTDRTAACILAKSKIEDVITSQVDSAAFTLYRHIDDADFGLAYLQEVLVVNPLDTSERYFGGVIRQITDYEEGDYFFYELDVVDFSWWLEHPRALINTTYTSQTDAAIIANFMATTNPDIDVATYVNNVGNITNIEFEDATARAALEELAKRVGADWYVDYDKYLHWFEATAGSAPAAPFTLTDGTGAGYGSRIPYQNLKRMTPAPEATKVEVIGAGSITATVTGTPVDGVHLVTKLVERDINDATQASNYGQALLDELGSAPSYSCTIFEPGIRSGQWVRLISNRRGIDDSYIVTRVTTSFLSPDGQLKMGLELGQFVPTLPEIIADVQEAVSGGSKGGAKSGGAGRAGAAGRGHGHSGGADSPQIGSGGIDPSAPIEGDKLAITLDGVSWPAGNPGDIDLDSPNATVQITPDDVNKKISFDVLAGALPYATPAIALATAAAAGVADSVVRSDATIVAFDVTAPADVGATGATGSAGVTARRDHIHRGVTSLTESTGIIITGADEPYGALTIAVNETENTRYAFKTITGDTGSAVAEIVDDSLAVVGGDGVTTTASDVAGADQLSVAVDFASTSTDVSGAASAAGTAVLAARQDHTHQGVSSLVASDGGVGEANLHGDVSVDGGGIVTVVGTEPSTLTISGPGYGGVANIQDVGSANAAGTNTAVPHADHVHKGVHSVAKSGDVALYGDVTLSGGANITLTQVGQNIEFAVTAGSWPTAAFTDITDGANTATADSVSDTLRVRGTGGTTATVANDDPTYGDVVTIDSHSGHTVSGNTGSPSSTDTPASGTHTHALSGNTGGASATVNVGSSGHTHSISYGTGTAASGAHRHGGNDTVVGDHGSHGHAYSGGTWGWSTSVEDANKTVVTSVSSPSGVPSATTSVAKGTHTHAQSGNTGSPSATVTVASSTHAHSGASLTVTGT